MDLNKLDVKKLANEGTIMKVRHPDPSNNEILNDGKKEPLDFYLRLLGSDSDVYRNAIKRRFENRRGKKAGKVDLDQAERDAAALLAKCTTDCYLILNGKPVECDVPTLTKIYLDFPWLKEQAEEHMGDRGNLLES